jgi:hypothetical protein
MEENNLTTQNSGVEKLLNEKLAQTDNVENAIDVASTLEALKREGTVDKLVDEKEEELRNKAEAKRLQAETEKIEKEVSKIRQEKEKELAELDKEIEKRKAEVSQLKTESDKSEVFFKSNKEILSCAGITSAKSLNVMYWFMPFAIIVFIVIRIIVLPLTIGGKIAEVIIEIVSGICETITNHALKIIISITVVAVLIACGICAYFYGGKLIL